MKINASATMGAAERWKLYVTVTHMLKSGLSWAGIQEELDDVWGTRQAAWAWYQKEKKFWRGVRRLEVKR